MPSVPHYFVLFMYDPFVKVQTYVNVSYVEQHLIDLVETMDQTKYYCIYKYKTNTFHFLSTQEAETYELHKTIKGKNNSGFFPFSPPEIAHHFKNSYEWYYQTTL